MVGRDTIGAMIAALVVAITLTTQAGRSALSEDHQRWLDENVRYIITDAERELFLSLSTRQERERAIEAFWDNRDPDRLTPENEYRVEHDRRMAHANRVFGQGASRAGYRTERGRYYILLGEPARVERFVGNRDVVESEIWFYDGDTALGFPPRFNLVFFKENNVGDFELYSPLDDGPAALLHSRVFLQVDRNASLDVLEAMSMDLARASLTVDLTEAVGSFLGRFTGLTPDGRPENPTIPLNVRPSQNSHLVLAIVEESGRSGVDTDYIDGYRNFGSRVSAEYSFKYISNRDYWTVLNEPDGTPFVHFSIELDPEDMTFRQSADGSKFETRLQIDIDVRNRAGGSIAIPTREPYISLTAEEVDIAKHMPVAYQDSFPLIPGAYQVSVTLRNLAGEHFTVAERNLSVQALTTNDAALGGVGVGYGVLEPEERGSFSSRGHRLLPSGRAHFPKGGDVHAFAQLAGGAADATVRVSMSGAGGVVQQTEMRARGGVASGALTLGDAPTGSYSVLFDLLDDGGNVVVTKSSAFDVVDVDALPRPSLVYRNAITDPEVDVTAMTIADQYIARGQLREAEQALRAVRGRDIPRADVVTWKLASVLLYTAQAAEALELLTPLEATYPDQAEVVEGLGFAHYLTQDYVNAIPRLEHAMGLRPPDISVLNATGDAYQQVGRADKALEMFELSLSVDPSQEAVRLRVGELRGQ